MRTYLPDLTVPPKLAHISSNLITPLPRFGTLWCESHRQAARDIRARWRRCGLWLFIAAWNAMLWVCLIWLSSPEPVGFGSPGACLPDGSFAMDSSNWRYLSSSGFFQITMATGRMNFTQVKVIDVSWDILVGRGGQALIAYISWRIFAKYVTTSMEVTPVTFGTYRTVFLPNGGLFFAILSTIRDFVMRHGLHSKIAMIFMIYTMIFTFIYPTLASAMTGYSANVEAFINSTAGEYVPFGSFGVAYFVIHDGWRIDGLQGDHIVAESPGGEPMTSSTYTLGESFRACYAVDLSDMDRVRCDMQLSVSKYAAEFGLNGGNMTNSTFRGQDLGPPALNISAPSLIRVDHDRFSIYYENQDFRVTYNSSALMWEYDNHTYTLDYLERSGSCQAVSDYNWGFSYVQLFIMIILHITWSSGLYIMWLRAYIIMKKRGRGKEDVAGEHKAVFELAAAMREQITDPAKEEGGDVSAFTEANLRRRITKDLRGGSISYTTPLLPNGGTGQEWDAIPWIKSHKLSIIAMVACIVAMALSAVYLLRTTMFLLPLPGVLALALYIGSTRKSRIVLFVYIYLIVTIPTQLMLMICAVQ